MTFLRHLALSLLAQLAAVLPAAERVRYHADWFPGAQFAGVYMALEQGLYREAGLDVEIVPFAYGQDSAAAIAADEDCALGTIEGYIFLQKRAAGVPLLALAAMLQESPAGFMSLESANIHEIRDFADKRIGVHKFADPLFRWFTRQAGLGPDKVTMIFTGDDVTQLERGELAAMQGFATEEFVRLQELTGGKARFLSFRELGFDACSQVVFTTPGQLGRHRNTLGRFLDATREGWIRAFVHPEEAVVAVQKHTGPSASLEFLRASLEAHRPYVMPNGQPPMGAMREEKWRRMQEVATAAGIISRREPPEAFLVPHLTTP